MEKLISTKGYIKLVPEPYILPTEVRPGRAVVTLCDTIPVIDLGNLTTAREKLIQQVVNCVQEFGFFQLVNHGIEEKLIGEVLQVAKDYFALPAEEKAKLFSDDPKQSSRLYTISSSYGNEEKHFWIDKLRHPCHPVEEHLKSWLKIPLDIEVMGRYSVKVRKLSLQLLELIGVGLGLENGYLDNEQRTKVQLMAVNHYPPCPDPSLTLGLPKHSDPNLLTLLIQGEVNGLQLFKDGRWLGVNPLTNAFVVNVGHMLQVISNGKLRSVDHRVVTNTDVARTTVGSFIFPDSDCCIGPAKQLVNDFSPALFLDFVCRDFMATYVTDTATGIFSMECHMLDK